MEVTGDAKVPKSGVLQGGKDLSPAQGITPGQSGSWGHMGIGGKKNAPGPCMADKDGSPDEIIVGNLPNLSVECHGNPSPRA